MAEHTELQEVLQSVDPTWRSLRDSQLFKESVTLESLQDLINDIVSSLLNLYKQDGIYGIWSLDTVFVDHSGRYHLLPEVGIKTVKKPNQFAFYPDYAAYELTTVDPDWPIGQYSDVYGLGMVLRTLILKAEPRSARLRMECDAPLAAHVGLEIPATALRVIDKATQVAISDRIQTVPELVQLLNAASQEQDSADDSSDSAAEGGRSAIPSVPATAQGNPRLQAFIDAVDPDWRSLRHCALAKREVTLEDLQNLVNDIYPTLLSVYERGGIYGVWSLDTVFMDPIGRFHLVPDVGVRTVKSADQSAVFPAYAAYELTTTDPDWPIGPHTDVYGIGMIMRTLVLKSPPLTPRDRLRKDFEPLSHQHHPSLSRQVLRVIDMALAFKISSRISTVAELLQLLNTLPDYSNQYIPGSTLKFPEEPPAQPTHFLGEVKEVPPTTDAADTKEPSRAAQKPAPTSVKKTSGPSELERLAAQQPAPPITRKSRAWLLLPLLLLLGIGGWYFYDHGGQDYVTQLTGESQDLTPPNHLADDTPTDDAEPDASAPAGADDATAGQPAGEAGSDASADADKAKELPKAASDKPEESEKSDADSDEPNGSVAAAKIAKQSEQTNQSAADKDAQSAADARQLADEKAKAEKAKEDKAKADQLAKEQKAAKDAKAKLVKEEKAAKEAKAKAAKEEKAAKEAKLAKEAEEARKAQEAAAAKEAQAKAQAEEAARVEARKAAELAELERQQKATAIQPAPAPQKPIRGYEVTSATDAPGASQSAPKSDKSKALDSAVAPIPAPSQPNSAASIVDQTGVKPLLLPEKPDTKAIEAAKNKSLAQNGSGTISFNITPWGNVKIDGHAYGASPPIRQVRLKAGNYRVQVDNGRGAPVTYNVTVTPGGTASVSHQF